jgi:hypothetical protein
LARNYRCAVLRAATAALVLMVLAPATAGACCGGSHLQPPHSQNPPLAIGDSVMLGAARSLARAGFEVDAREGRFMRHAIAILRRERSEGLRPPAVVIAIGTNLPATSGEISRALGLLDRWQRLVLVTPRRSWRALPSGPLWAAQLRHPRRVRVLDWASYSAGHPDWFVEDGTHLRPAGVAGYTQLLEEALLGLPRGCSCMGSLHGPGRIRTFV